MLQKKQDTMVPTRVARDPFALFRQMTSDFDRMFGEPFFPVAGVPGIRNA